MNLEYQRYGRNKDTVIDSTYINSGEYRKKFDNMSDNPDVSRELYKKAKEMLHHRSGTLFEDMCWIDGETGKLIAEVKDSTTPQKIQYDKNVIEKLSKHKNIIAVHTHPGSYPPSTADFNAYFELGYEQGYVLCHDGKIFKYSAGELIDTELYLAYIRKYKDNGLDEYEAQIKTISQMSKNSNINLLEVKA
jgi:hypothetical protein